MTTQPDPHLEDAPWAGLIEAVNALSGHIVGLTERVDLGARQMRLTRILVGIVGLLLVLVTVGGVWNFIRVNHALYTEHTDAVQACQNANDTRSANLALWQYVLRISPAAQDPANKDKMDQFAQWISVLYAPHDCNDLGKVYEIPAPPDFDSLG